LKGLLRFDDAPRGLTVCEAARQAVIPGGKRIRPILALCVARLLRSEGRLSLKGAAAVELLHCASLVIDDLPCMDNSSTRRDGPALHASYGQAVALLAALALISVAARTMLLATTSDEVRREDLLGFHNQLLGALDCSRMLGGQEMDLRMSMTAPQMLRRTVAELKTVPLFTLAIRAGCLEARPEKQLFEHLLTFGSAFGRFYQSLDDYMDGCPIHVQDLAADWRRLRAYCDTLGVHRASLVKLVESLEPPDQGAALTLAGTCASADCA
jgi:geranylgeranyl diphosphate synthase, type II